MTSLILRTATRLLFPPLVVLAVVLLYRGHNAPGGGFIAALLVGVAIALRALTTPTERTLRFPQATTWLGVGLLLALGTGVAPLLLGLPLLTGDYVAFTVPVIGEQKLTSSLVFDLGVAAIVIGLLRGIVDALDRPTEGRSERRS